MRKLKKQILKAFSMNEIDVEEARKIANLKGVGIGKYFYSKWDTSVQNDDYEVPVRVFFPSDDIRTICLEGGNTLPIIMYLHGGGWVTGNVDTYERVCHRLAYRLNRIVVSVEYRLAPEYKFPVGLTDCYAVMQALCKDEFTFLLNTDNITIMGDSAGGNLATVSCMMARDRGEPYPQNQILLYPVVNNDYSESSPFESVHTKGESFMLTAGQMSDYVELYQNAESDRENPYFAPILSDNLEEMPDTLIITAEYDPLRDEGEAYGAKLRENNIKVQIYRIRDVIHGFFGVGIYSKGIRETLYLTERFLKE